MNRKTFFIIFAIGAALRMFMIARATLWYDENFTLILARLPFDRMIQATAGDVHPPLWYLIEWVLYHALPTLPAWGIRIPALVFSLLALWTFAAVLKEIDIPFIQPLAFSLMAVTPMQIWYAQEGRMYALLEFLVLAALLAGLKRQWSLLFIASFAMVYTQNYGLFYLAIISLVLVIRRNDILTVWGVLWNGGMTGLAYLPWIVTIVNQMAEIHGRYWIMDAGAGAVLNAIYKQFWAGAMLPAGQIVSHVVTFVVLIFGVRELFRRHNTDAARTVFLMAFGPVIIAWAASWLWQPLLLFRPLIGISPFLYIIAAWPLVYWDRVLGFAMIPETKYRLLVAIFTAPLFLWGLAGYYLNIADIKGEGATAPLLDTLAYVRAHWQPGDVIYYTDDGPMVNLLPYAGDLPQYRLPACDERIGFGPVLGSLSDTTRAAFDIQIADLPDVPHQRAWIFAPRSPLHPQCYEDQIAALAPIGGQLITVDDNEYISSGVWLAK